MATNKTANTKKTTATTKTTATKTATKTTATKATAVKKTTAAAPQITHDMIATRAYGIWLGSGRPHGNEMAIWLQAEAELEKKTGKRAK